MIDFFIAIGLCVVAGIALVLFVVIPPFVIYALFYIDSFFTNLKDMRRYAKEMDERLYLRDVHKETVEEYEVQCIVDDKWGENPYWFPVLNYGILFFVLIWFVWKIIKWMFGDILILIVGCIGGVGIWLFDKLKWLKWVWKGPVILIKKIWFGGWNKIGNIKLN